MQPSYEKFEDFLKQARFNIPEEEAEVYDRLYYQSAQFAQKLEYQEVHLAIGRKRKVTLR